MNNDEIDLRATLEAAYDTHEDTGNDEDDSTNTSRTSQTVEETTGVDSEVVKDSSTTDDKSDVQTKDDASGKKTKTEEPDEKSTPESDTGAKEGTETEGKAGEKTSSVAPPSIAAPASWKPGPREHWNKLDRSVQEEVVRREREISNTLRESAEDRRLAKEFKDTIQPFMQFIEADRSTPIMATKNLMATAAGLRVGTPMQKAKIAADIITNFGIDIQTLDNLLSGQTAQSNPLQNELEQRLAPINQFMREQQQRQYSETQQMQTSLVSEMQEFANDPKNEFFNDVKDIMADILDIAAQRGIAMDLQTAYNRAIMEQPEISAVLAQRKADEQAAAQAASALRAKKKAVSVKGAPQTSTSSEGESLRDTIANAMETHAE